MTSIIATRTLADGSRLDLVPLLFGFRLCLALPGDCISYADEW